MTSARRAISIPIAVIGLVIVLGAGVAAAYWSAVSVAGGSGASAAATVNQGATPTATAAATDVTVSWAASTLSSADPVAGYIVKRYAASGLALQSILTSCTGTVTATSCTESSVPPGRWVYSVTPVLGTYWTGAESLKSASVTTDSTAPVNAISASAVTGSAFKSADTIFYRGAAAGSFTLSNAVSDSGSGPASSATASLGGSTTGWTHTPSTASSPTGGPYVSNAFSWTSATTTGPTEVVTGRDVAGNAATTTLTFIDDSTSPSAGSVGYSDGYQPGQSVVVTFASGTDSGSGVATRQLQRSSATLTAGSCGTFGGFADVGPVNPTSAYTDSAVSDGTCYQYRYVVTDQVGNQAIATSTNVAKVDSGGGGPALRTAASYSVLAATSVANAGGTNLSGDLGVSPGTGVTGFPPGTVGGDIHAGDAAAAQAQADLVLAYNDAAGRTQTGTFSGDLNGLTFGPGVYYSAAAVSVTGTVTLDAQGNPNAIFILQVNAALGPAAGSHVALVNGTQASHVFWQVNGAVTTGADSYFAGTMMAAGAITLGANTELIGRALSYGAVVLSTNAVRFTTALPPVVTIDGGATAVTKYTTPTITGTSNAATGTTVKVKVAGQVLTTTLQSNGTWGVTASALIGGAHTVTASVRDSAGNAGGATQTLTVEINPDPVALGTAGTYSVLAATGVVNTGLTTLTGDLGVGPASTISGFPPGTLAGVTHVGDPAAVQAQADLVSAYNDAAGRTPSGSFAGDLNGLTFHAGVHHSTAAMALTGTVTLDGEGDPNAVFIFQVDAAMSPAAASTVSLVNGAQASHVFWAVKGAASIGATSHLAGTIMAKGAITMGAGTVLSGRALSYGTVTMDDVTVATG